jgi:hypothetical protein
MGRAAATKTQAANEVAAENLPLRLEWRTPAELAENPKNWRTHPAAQVEALEDVLGDVGWAGACLYNERTGRLIDGHARRNVRPELMVDGKVPVLVGSWTEEQEAKILATLDPLAAMAGADAQKLDELLQGIHNASGAVARMLSDLADQAGTKDSRARGGGGGEDGPDCEYPLTPVPGEKYDYVLIFCENESDYAHLLTMLKVGKRQDYKSTAVRPGRVVRFREFRAAVEEWAKHATHGGHPLGGAGGAGAGGPGDRG